MTHVHDTDRPRQDHDPRPTEPLITLPTVEATSPARKPPSFAHGTASPRALAAQHRLDVLERMNRFRVLRAIDVAAALFADRAYKAALSAAQRAIGRLVRDRMLTRYRSLSGHTYYGLAQRGANLLRESGRVADAQASASRACERTNPEHALWAAFAVVCCESRGMRARTEQEFMTRLRDAYGPNVWPLSYEPYRAKRKGLIPDAVALEGRTLVWFEIDRSARGSDRLEDLLALVRAMGDAVPIVRDHALPMRRIVVWCKTPHILRRNRTHLTGLAPETHTPRIAVDAPPRSALREVQPNVFEVSRDRLVGDAVRTVVEGVLHLQLLPLHLLRYGYGDGPARGWFDDDALPFTRDWSEVAKNDRRPGKQVMSVGPGPAS